MDVKIKICGLKRPEDIDTANDLGLDYIGFIFAKKSIRYIDYDRAAQLKSRLSSGINAVGVFVNENPKNVIEACERGIIDIIQLHGSEDEPYICDIRKSTDAKIIKAFKTETAEDIERANASSADLVLLDNGEGGTGKSFDWSLLSGIGKAFLLAGGLTPENIRSAIENVEAAGVLGFLYGVDISSGVETDGYKDFKKMRDFVSEVRSL